MLKWRWLMAARAYEGVPLERLEHEISTLAAHIYAATCRWLLMIAEFDRREGWATWGMTSCAEWLSFKCSLSHRSARDHVRVSRALAELPQITKAFAAGELSYSKVRALTRIATAETESDLMAIARHCSAAQLDTLAMQYRRARSQDEELAEVNRRHRDRYVTWHYDDYGMLKIEAYLDPEEGAVVAEALGAAVDATRLADKPSAAGDSDDEGGSAEPQDLRNTDAEVKLPGAIHHYADPDRSFLQRAADGLVMVAETYLAAGPMARKGGDRYQVMLHLDAAVLAEGDPGIAEEDVVPRNRCHIDRGPALARETMERLLCDSSIVGVVEKDGAPLSIGNKSRKIPVGMRRALELRDGCCQWAGCNRKGFTDAHHVVHWPTGETKLDNLVLLCRIHHRMVHEGGYTLWREQNGEVRVFRPDGIEIPRAAFMRVSGQALEERNKRLDLTVDDETCMTLDDQPMDVSDAVAGLLQTERVATPT